MLPPSSGHLCIDIPRTLRAVLILQPKPYAIQYPPPPPYSQIYVTLVCCLCFSVDKRGLLRANICLWLPESKLCYDRLSVGQWACWCGAPCLTRGRVCRLQLMLALASAIILGSECRGTHDHILLSQIRDCPNMEGQVPVFISPRNRVARLYPQILDYFFVASYYSQGYGWGMRSSRYFGSYILYISYCIATLRLQPWKWRQ
jgi:hypothetical protein